MKKQIMEKYVSVRTACEICGVTPPTIYRWIAEGLISNFRLDSWGPGLYFLSRVDVNKQKDRK